MHVYIQIKNKVKTNKIFEVWKRECLILALSLLPLLIICFLDYFCCCYGCLFAFKKMIIDLFGRGFLLC